MSGYERLLRRSLSQIPPAAHVALHLPFTPDILLDPTPLLATVYQTVIALPERTLLVYFCDPDKSNKATQLYDAISSNPRAHWDVFQSFLARVYAALWAGQCEAEKMIDLSVDVGFGSRLGAQTARLSQGVELALYLEGYEPRSLQELPSPKSRHALPCPPFPSSSACSSFALADQVPGPPVVALGGTFDHLHAAHKLLLQLAHFLAHRKVIVGVMSADQLVSKTHAELIEDTQTRKRRVEEFMRGLSGDALHTEEQESGDGRKGMLELDVVEITDPYGPTADDSDIQALVISDETRSGGEAVNRKRRERALEELEIWCIDVISVGQAASAPTSRQDGAEGRSQRREEWGSAGWESTQSGGGVLKDLDEKTLKAVKMGSTAIRRMLADRQGKA